jgi:hypothetical protein
LKSAVAGSGGNPTMANYFSGPRRTATNQPNDRDPKYDHCQAPFARLAQIRKHRGVFCLLFRTAGRYIALRLGLSRRGAPPIAGVDSPPADGLRRAEGRQTSWLSWLAARGLARSQFPSSSRYACGRLDIGHAPHRCSIRANSIQIASSRRADKRLCGDRDRRRQHEHHVEIGDRDADRQPSSYCKSAFNQAGKRRRFSRPASHPEKP